jgi:plasmid stability protein
MSKTLTIRTDSELRRALVERAEAQGKSLSQVVREILEESVRERPMRVRIGHLRGQLDLSGEGVEQWHRKIRERNWRS